MKLVGPVHFLSLMTVTFLAYTSTAADFYVSPGGAGIPPFATWETAATNIQDAIDAASAGDNVWVTNGVYASGGKVMAGNLTNRVALDKALNVQSINGPLVTTIQGAWDPVSTNGPLSIRCAWLTNGAILEGFTLTGGATANSGGASLESGGGAWGASSGSVVSNCLISGNCAAYEGGGAYGAWLSGCSLISNRVFGVGVLGGGGAAMCSLTNCLILTNQSASSGGGQLQCYLRGCALEGNAARGSGGGGLNGTLLNCTVIGNTAGCHQRSRVRRRD